MSQAKILRAVETIAATWDCGGDEQVAALTGDGFSEGEARRLLALLPIAFSRPILEELGVGDFVTTVTATRPDGTPISADLMRQPEYVEGLKLARAHRSRGVMDHEIYKLIALSSADLNAVDEAINEGADLNGATIATSFVDTEIANHLIR